MSLKLVDQNDYRRFDILLVDVIPNVVRKSLRRTGCHGLDWNEDSFGGCLKIEEISRRQSRFTTS